MVSRIQVFFSKRLLKQLITFATQAIYSEQFDIDAVVNRLSRNKQGVPLLRAYIAIQSATRLAEPLKDADVDHAYERLCDSEQHSDSSNFESIIDVHKELAEIYWLQKQKDILKGKLSHKNNEDSYEGTIYSIEFSRKGPITTQERAAFKAICREMEDIDQQIENLELEAMKKAGDPTYQDAKEDREICILRDEVNKNEDGAIDEELCEVVAMLENKLESLLQVAT